MAKTIIGKVGMTLKRQWNSTTAYERLDTVTHEGRSYAALKDNIGVEPTLESEVWQLLADKGHFTEQDKEEFKQAVVEESKTKITEHTEAKKTELDNYTSDFETSLKNELDTYEVAKEAQLDIYKTTLETEMSNTKDDLVQEITEAQNGFNDNVTAKTTVFNSNATAKTTAFNNNVTEKTNTFNSNVETKTTEFDTNANTKKTEFNNNSTAKLEEYNSNDTAKLEAYNDNATEKTNAFNSNAEEKTTEFNENAEALTNRVKELETEVDELAQQASWKTTDIAESIHIEDSAKYSRNKLDIFGNMRQETREGYNELDLTGYTVSGDKITITQAEDKHIIVNGTADTAQRLRKTFENPLFLAKGTYIFDFGVSSINFNCELNLVALGKGVYKTVKNYSNNVDSIQIAFDEDFEIYNYNIAFKEDASFNNFNIYPMIYKKSTEEKTYEPYGAMPSMEFESMPVVATGVQKTKKCQNNLFDINSDVYPKGVGAYYIKNRINITKWDGGGSITTENGKLTAGDSSKTYKGIRISAFLEPNTTYYINFDFESELTTVANTTNYQKAKNGKNTISFITDKEGKKFFGIGTQEGIGYFTMSNIMISKDNIDFEPYNGEDITLDLKLLELCKIGDYRDYIYRNAGIWYKKKLINKLILTGNEVWGKSYGDNLFNTLSIQNTIAKSGGCSNYYRYSNVQSGIDANLENGEFAIQFSSFNTETKLFIKNTNFFDVTSFKEHLKELYNANNPVVVYYPLETAIDEQITDKSLIEQLERLYKLQLEKGTNNIFVESENGVTTELQLTYMQDSNLIKEQEHKELEDRITAIENLLSTTATSAMLLDNLQSDLESEVK